MVEALSDWGLAGLEALRSRVSVLVIVDVLSFSTAVDIAVSRGARVYPFPLGDDDATRRAALASGAALAAPRKAAGGQFSLSPASLATLTPGTQLMLPSPNGSRLSLAAGDMPVLTGCLRNAHAVADAAQRIAGGGSIGVIAAGELWADGSMRPAVEDLLGAGAILDGLDMAMAAEAQVARDAFRASLPRLGELVRASVSGRELIDRGFAQDVELAVELGVSRTAPLLVEGAYRAVP